MAVGSRRFLEMAIDMTLSLREHTGHGVAIVVDEAIHGVVRDLYPTVFDHVCPLPERFRDGRALKYGLASVSPFDETAFVDADCIVLGSLEHAWSALDEGDFAFLGETLTASDNENHHGFSTRSLMRSFDLDRYLKTNSGFFVFRTAKALDVMDEMRDSYLHEIRPRLRWQIVLGRWVGDEIGIGVVGGRHGLGTLPKPAEMYWPKEIETIDLNAPTKPLLHWIWPLQPHDFEVITERARARRTEMGVLDTGSEHWVQEQSNLQTMARRRRLLEWFKVWPS